MPTRPFWNSCLVRVCFLGFVYSSSSLLVSYSHLSPTTSNSTCHIGRRLTSIKFRCKIDVHWFNKFVWPIRTGCILQPWKWLEISKCQRTITTHQRSRSALLATNSHSFTSSFPYFLETLCPYFEKYGRTSKLPADFCTNTVKYGWAGRSALQSLCYGNHSERNTSLLSSHTPDSTDWRNEWYTLTPQTQIANLEISEPQISHSCVYSLGTWFLAAAGLLNWMLEATPGTSIPGLRFMPPSPESFPQRLFFLRSTLLLLLSVDTEI